MPPKRPADQLPKPMMEAADALKAQGLEVTGENLASLPHALRVKAFSSLNTALNTRFQDKAVLFKNLQDDNDKREYLASFMIDPKSGGTMTNKSSREVIEKTTKKVLWVTLEQYGGPLFLNSMEHAKIALEGEPSRPHENKKLADTGAQQFRVEVTEEVFEKVLEESAELAKQVELSAEEFEPVANVLKDKDLSGPSSADGSTKPPMKRRRQSRRATPAATEPDPPAGPDLATKASQESLAKELSELKKFYDKSKKELGEAKLIEQKLASKAWGGAATDYLKEAVDKMRTEMGQAFNFWAETKGKTHANNQERDADSASAKAMLTEKKREYDTFKTNTLSEFLKFKK
ncbi:unnamed protein product [Prorocentrum cordatum]|uniref:Uncharacterized protein n=1 Tax=Prorocentrum cordatum TaxID=2364126 RepID=A0ABN9RNM9_9DINO|nr:unnamed protein product [Polarella glacialis]